MVMNKKITESSYLKKKKLAFLHSSKIIFTLPHIITWRLVIAYETSKNQSHLAALLSHLHVSSLNMQICKRELSYGRMFSE